MKDAKNIYELLNDMDINLEDYDKKELDDMEKRRLKNNFRKTKMKKVNLRKIGTIAVVAVFTIGLLGQTNLGKNVYAAAQSKVSEISYSIGEGLGIKRNIEPYANVVNKVVEDKKVEVKLTDVIIDKDELIFSTIINTNKPVSGIDFDYDIIINGRKLSIDSASCKHEGIEGSETLFLLTHFVETKGIDLKQNLDIKIVFYNLNYRVGEEDKRVKGNWEFEFNASGSELMADTHVLPINYSFSIDDQKYTLEEFRYNPVSQKIFGKIEGKTREPYWIDLKGYDNLGNEVVFFLASVSGEELIFKYENMYRNLSDEITSITLAPYVTKTPEDRETTSDDVKKAGEEFTIFLMK